MNAGLAVEADDSGLIFQLDWGTKQFNAFLRRQFPALFSHFDSVLQAFNSIPDEPDALGMKRIEYSLPYVLVQKIRKSYLVVDDTHLDAKKYKSYLSGDTTNAGFRAKSIFLSECHSTTKYLKDNLISAKVTKEPIPQGVLNNWFAPLPAPTVPTPASSKAAGTRSKRSRGRQTSASNDSSTS